MHAQCRRRRRRHVRHAPCYMVHNSSFSPLSLNAQPKRPRHVCVYACAVVCKCTFYRCACACFESALSSPNQHEGGKPPKRSRTHKLYVNMPHTTTYTFIYVLIMMMILIYFIVRTKFALSLCSAASFLDSRPLNTI